MAGRARRFRPSRQRVIGLVAGTIVLLGFGTGVVFAATSADGHYVTAITALGSVDETLTVDGTIASASRRDMSFSVGGTVESVQVEVGDTVEPGATLATLDDESLQDAVDQAQSKVTQAQQALDSDLESQTNSASSSAPGSSSPSSSGSSSGPTPAQTAALAAVTAAQADLQAKITAAGTALGDSQTAVTAASTGCTAFASATAPVTTDPLDPAYDPAVEAANLATWLTDRQTELTVCQSAVADAGTKLGLTSAAQNDIVAAATALDAAVAQLQSAYASGSSGGGGSSSGSSTPATSGGGGATASAADIIADRAAIAAAEAEVAIAEQQRSGATLTSPIAGTVGQITFAKGDTVAAGSADAVISVVGDDGYVIESTVSLAQVKKVKAGQDVAVTISSTGETYEGSVSAVGIVNVSETSDPAYSITISVDAAGDTLLNGAAASAQIAVASAEDVLTVPISALHSGETGDTVDLLIDGEPVATPVEVGAIGADAVEIASGLSAGDVVVLADLDEEIDADTSSGGTGLSGLTSGGGGPTFTQGRPPVEFTRPGQ
jgi:multidrug efflux pump subunit AcrA (membrane-fusion protein)